MTKLLGFLVVLCSFTAACSSPDTTTAALPAVSDLRPVEGFRLRVGLDGVAAKDDHVPVAVGETVEHPVTANDVETSRLVDIDTLEIVAPPELGTASVLDVPLDQIRRAGAARVIQYTPHNLDIDYEDSLEDSLTYQICDKGPDPQCSTAQLRMTIFSSGYPYWEYGW